MFNSICIRKIWREIIMSEKGNDVISVRRFLKDRLQNDLINLRGHVDERKHVCDMLRRTIELSESNSLLLIGPRGSGKSILVNSVLAELMPSEQFQNNALLVYLNGNLHTDDRLALTAATEQMQLENTVDGKVFGSFAENLSFLLASLRSGDRTKTKSVIFILDEFDLFCAHHNQTLLYNLFDVSQSAQAPICVLGITCRLDVIELLEKRVKSRFSHRQIFMYPGSDDIEDRMNLFTELLTIPSEKERKKISEKVASVKKITVKGLTFHRRLFNPTKYTFNKKFSEKWNDHIMNLSANTTVRRCMENICKFDLSEAYLKTFLFQIVSDLDDETHPDITADDISCLWAVYEVDDKVQMLCDLSVLELCVVIIIKHHSEIYDRDPFNFEIIFNRFNKFANISSTMRGIQRHVVLTAFEHLRNLELIIPLTTTTGKTQKEFELHKFALTFGQINQAISKYQALPTDVFQLAQSSLM